MKKQVIALIDTQLKRLRKSVNTLDSDAAALVNESVAELERLRADAEASDDVVGVDDIVNRVRDIIDEKINAALEKVKDIDDIDKRENYLKSSNAVKDYADALRTSGNDKAAFCKKWGEALRRNGITFDQGGEAGFMPEMMRSRIEDSWNSDTNWLRRLNNTGAKRFAIRFTEQGQDDIAVRAKGHKRGETKNAQDVELSSKILSAQAIYKLLPVDKLTEYEDDGELLRWVSDEITRQLFFEIGRAIVVGDGRQASDPEKITSFEAIDRASSDAFVNVATVGGGADLVEEVMRNVIAPIYDGTDVILFVGKDDLFDLRRYVSGSGATTRYASIDEVKGMLGVSDIVVVPYLDSTTTGGARMVALHPDKYYTVGTMRDFAYVSWEEYLTNQRYFRGETFAGGGAGILAGAVLKNA